MAKYDLMLSLDILGEDNLRDVMRRVTKIWTDYSEQFPVSGLYFKRRKLRNHEPLRLEVLFEDINGYLAMESLRENETRLIKVLPGVYKMTILVRAGTGSGMFERLDLDFCLSDAKTGGEAAETNEVSEPQKEECK